MTRTTELGPQGLEDLGNFRRPADSFASVASEFAQGIMQMVARVTMGRPPQFDDM